MQYTRYDVEEFVREHDVKFVRLEFCDILGNQKNISVVPQQLPKAFEYGISFDASAVKGFMNVENSDLLLKPDPATMCVLPWRSHDGTVIRMFCDIYKPDGTPFTASGRYILKNACGHAREMGYTCRVGTECEFYLFLADKDGAPTLTPLDRGGYFDIYPLDRGENVRREICNTLTEMGLNPERSHHEQGPGQNEIDFRHSEPVSAADNLVTFRWIVSNVAQANGLAASFDPKPLEGESGNGLHVNISLQKDGENIFSESGGMRRDAKSFIAGVMRRAAEIAAFTNPLPQSYDRLGSCEAPKYITWSRGNRSQLIRLPYADEAGRRIELRSPDPSCNPYLVFALIIEAGLEGIRENLQLEDACDMNMFRVEDGKYPSLPGDITAAANLARKSAFVERVLSREVTEKFLER